MSYDDLFIEYNKLPKPLTKDEIYSSFEKIKKGDLEAREYVITHNIRLVVNEVCKKFGATPYEKKELVSVGLVGLVKSVDTFDISKKYEFATYAARCIDNEILMFIRKAKKYIFDQSIDTPIGIDQDGNEKKIEDILEDITADFVSDYMNEITYNEIRKIVYDLPDKDREIILLRFGFINNKTYTQLEISQKLNISQSYISRLIKKIVKKIGLQCAEKGIIQGEVRTCENSITDKQSLDNSNELEKEKRIAMAKKLRTIYEYFSDYTREEINDVLDQLTEEEMKVVRLRYGDDLDHPVTKELYFTQSVCNKFYSNIIPKIKELLKAEAFKRSLSESENSETSSKEVDLKLENTSLTPPTVSQKSTESSSTAQVIDNIPLSDTALEEPAREPDTTSNKSETTANKDLKNTYFTIPELMRTPSFGNMLKTLNTKEAIIICLLGYVDGKDFTTESIAQFLGIEQAEVREITKKVLMVYKENINQFIDNAIDVVTGKSLTLKRKEK